MSDLTVTLKGAVADKLRRLVADGRYARPEDAVAEAIEALDAGADLDAWLGETIAARAEAHVADPSRALTPAQVRAALRS